MDLPPYSPTTSVSLLDRLKQSTPQESDWHRLQEIYFPLIRKWLGRVPGLGDEADDLAQEVFLVLIREIPKFNRMREGSFRAWLRQVTVNRVRTHWKERKRRPSVGIDPTETFLGALADANGDLAREWDREHDNHVIQKLMTIVRGDFGAVAWQAFEKFALAGIPAGQVAAELGVTENSVLQAKSRIIRRLRQEAGDFLD
jgi:RNA polymerase sigma-70 factor, ECF subfamily